MSHTLPKDIARCEGIGFDDGSGIAWREGCSTCLRRTAPRPKEPLMMEPPAIIAFECEHLISPPPAKP
jgi:hypothetical protein